MHLIIDAYNVIKSGLTDIFDGMTLEQQRGLFIRLVNENRPQGSPNNKVTAVFDGSYEVSLASGTFGRAAFAGGLEVIYTEGEPADDLIERLVLELKNRAEATIVTDDKGLIRRLGGTGVNRMSVDAFLARLVK
jgi:predicted RNA-binding protein with PIN domain